MNEELKDSIRDSVKMAVYHDLSYAEYDEDVLAEDFPGAEYVDPTFYLEDRGRTLHWPLEWLDYTSCGGLFGTVPNSPHYELRTVADGASPDDMVYGIQLEWGGWKLTLWQSDVGQTEVTWQSIEQSVDHVLSHAKFPG